MEGMRAGRREGGELEDCRSEDEGRKIENSPWMVPPSAPPCISFSCCINFMFSSFNSRISFSVGLSFTTALFWIRFALSARETIRLWIQFETTAYLQVFTDSI